MERSRRRHRFLSLSAFGLLALVAELAGRSLTHRLDLGRHVAAPSYAGAGYYPFLLAGVKIGIALLLARLAWRFVKARSAARAARRVVAALGHVPATVPRMRIVLSPRLWLVSFAVTSSIYLVQADAEGLVGGRWPLLAPWVHSSALPIFAVLSVLVALVWGAVQGWLAEYESYAEASVDRARRLASATAHSSVRPLCEYSAPPRRLFGLDFESRPPPLPA